MRRRDFLAATGGSLTAMPVHSQTASPKTRFYLLTRYLLANGTQPARIHDYLSKHWVPRIAKLTSAPPLCLDALVAPHMPQVLTIAGFESLDLLLKAKSLPETDPELAQGFASWETGAEPPYQAFEDSILQATSYSPEMVPPAPLPKAPRLFELRLYHSPTQRQLKALHERFAGPEIRIFHRVGVHPVFYSSTLIGPDMPNLVYLTPFADLAAREKAWNAFAVDPEWVKVRQESIDRHGQITAVIQISLYRPTKYSFMQ